VPSSQSFSAPYRLQVLLDGTRVIDSAFIAALISQNGVSFLGCSAPSWNAVAEDGSFFAGNIKLMRGMHEVQIKVSDFAQNTSTMRVFLDVRSPY